MNTRTKERGDKHTIMKTPWFRFFSEARRLAAKLDEKERQGATKRKER